MSEEKDYFKNKSYTMRWVDDLPSSAKFIEPEIAGEESKE